MNEIPPSDRPTQHLRPGPPLERERERLVERHDPLILERLEEAVRSLRTAVMLLGALAAIALGVAVYAVIKADDAEDDGGRSGASRGRVAELDDRVDRLSRQVRSLRGSNSGDADSGDLESLRGEISGRATKAQVDELSSRIDELGEGGSGGDTAALEERLDTLAEQVEELQTSQTP